MYPYGLNDNVRRLGNVSKQIRKNMVVYSIFNKQARKFHRRSRKRRKHKVDGECLRQRFKVLLDTYKSPTFTLEPFYVHYLSIGYDKCGMSRKSSN